LELELKGKRLMVTLLELFLTFITLSCQLANRQLLDTLRTFDWIALSQEPSIRAFFTLVA
jgi:hypothetical protein